MPKELLSDVLRGYLQDTDTGTTRLANLSKVPRKTINHWLSGHVLSPQRWQPLIRVALVLHLTEAQTNRLLMAAGHDSLRKLLARAQGEDQKLLAPFRGPALATAPAPFLAPQKLATFVARQEAAATLREALLSHGQAVIFGVRGMGGVGKTTLATHLAYELQPDFPDGVLWARVDTSDALSILLTFADAYGKDVSQYRDVQSRATVVRSVLASKRALIVLDNAETGEQIEPLLPPSGSRCAVLITTRNDLSPTDGWPYIELAGFSQTGRESLLLFEKLIGPARTRRHRPALLQIADLLGHLPLALAIAGGQLAFALRSVSASEAGPLIHALLGKLQHESSRLSRLNRDRYSVRVSFNLSYDRLPGDVRQFFAQLGVFGGQDFSVEAAAHIGEVDVAMAQAHFDLLVRRSLIQPSRQGRYRLHPLLRDYAREQLAAQSTWKDASLGRSIDYFSRYVHQNAQDFPAIDVEIDNVLYALNVINLAQDQDHGTIFNVVAQALYPYFETRGLFDQASRIYTQAQKIAHASGRLEDQAKAIYMLASIRLRLAEYPTVVDLCQRGLVIAREIDHKHLIFDFSRTISSAYYARGDFKGAVPYAQTSLDVARELNDLPLVGRLLCGFGMMLFELGDIDQGRAYLLEGRTIALVNGDVTSASVACLNLSEIAMELGEIQASLAWAEAGEALARSIGHRERLANLLGDLGHAKSVLGRFDEAEAHFLEALPLAEPMPWLCGFVNNFYARHLLRTNRTEAAEAMCLKAIQIALEITSAEILASAQLSLAQVRLAQHRPEEARQLAETARQSYQTRQPVRVQAVSRWLRESGLSNDSSHAAP